MKSSKAQLEFFFVSLGEKELFPRQINEEERV
jgi:hypothetical protein